MIILLQALVDGLLFGLELSEHGLGCGDEFIFSLIGLIEFIFIAGCVLVIILDGDTFGVAIVETFGGDSGEVFSIDILGEETMDVTCVTGDVLSLQLVGGSTDPGDSVLDMVVVGDLFGCVH
eukprot:TRINITY_DN59041_c0_g1_i1.p2 TRINITY_DN59041_c0_g1~~TRINITY_DN59041_c0_g1_i1.p2  ORF type:complete len:122 (+),score=5.79 TRINITY_DN59041_c0_g1_i1:256-621(+)